MLALQDCESTEKAGSSEKADRVCCLRGLLSLLPAVSGGLSLDVCTSRRLNVEPDLQIFDLEVADLILCCCEESEVGKIRKRGISSLARVNE